MINLAVINLKDLIKIMLKIVICITVVLIILKIIRMIKFNKIKEFVSNYSFVNCLNKEIAISNYGKESSTKSTKNNILSSQFALFGYEADESKKDSIELYEEISESSIENIDTIDNLNSTNEYQEVQTEIIEDNNIPIRMTDSYGNVAIKNESDYSLVQDVLSPEMSVSNKKDILIFHTHTCESYTPTEQNNYEASGNYRTTDLNYSVVRVGTELENRLKEKRI